MQRISTVTRKGQVTIPNDIRAVLGIREGDKVAFQLEDGVLTVRNMGRVADRTGLAGAGQPRSAEEMRELAADLIAAATVERSGGGRR